MGTRRETSFVEELERFRQQIKMFETTTDKFSRMTQEINRLLHEAAAADVDRAGLERALERLERDWDEAVMIGKSSQKTAKT